MTGGHSFSFITLILVISSVAWSFIIADRLCKDAFKRHLLSRLVFDATMGLSLLIGELILCEVSDWLHPSTRTLLWKLSIRFLVVSIILVIPFLDVSLWLCHFTGVKSRRQSFLLAMPIFAIWLFILYKMEGLVASLQTPQSGDAAIRTTSLGAQGLLRIGLIGVSVMAILSGFGCITTPLTVFFTLRKPLTEYHVEKVQASIKEMEAMIQEKQMILNQMEMKNPSTSSRRSFTNLVQKVMPSFRQSSERRQLKRELQGLGAIQQSLETDLVLVKWQLQDQQYSKTIPGKLYRCGSIGFSIYCMYKLVTTLIIRNPLVTKLSFSQTDPITRGLALVARYWDPSINVNAWTRQIGFLLAGVIFATSMTSLVTIYNRLTRHLPKIKDSAATGLLVSEFVGMYALSTALLLRSNLPRDISTALTRAMEHVELDPSQLDRWFDTVFVVAAVITAITVYLAGGSGGGGVYDADEYIAEQGAVVVTKERFE